MRILFCAQDLTSFGSKDRQRLETLRELGHDVIPFEFQDFSDYGWRMKVTSRFGFGGFPKQLVDAFNQRMISRVTTIKPDVVWVAKALLLLPETIMQLKSSIAKTLWVSYQDDNPFGRRRNEIPIWKQYIAAIPQYDIHFVKREADCVNYLREGANRVIISRTGFSPRTYHPYALRDVPTHLQHGTVFIGTPLDHRVESITYLLRNASLDVHVYGHLWNRHPIYYLYRSAFHGYAGPEYPLIVSGSKISLGYVSSSNLDEYTHRSLDIPACGGFLLTERTPTHQELFEEGKEAEFFESDAECAEKIRFYLYHEDARQAIARCGYERCMRSGYSQADSMKKAIDEIMVFQTHYF
jgi:spore maturation protein CgeB